MKFILVTVFGAYREILQEIQRLRLEHEQASQPTPEKAQQNPTLLAELRLLRYTNTFTHSLYTRMYKNNRMDVELIRAFNFKLSITSVNQSVIRNIYQVLNGLGGISLPVVIVQVI